LDLLAAISLLPKEFGSTLMLHGEQGVGPTP